MPYTKHHNQSSVILLLMGVPYIIQGGWVIRETNNISNDIQQTVNPKYEPAIRFASSTLTVEFRLPTGLDLKHHAWARLVRTALITLSESLSGEQYENLNYEEQIPVDAVGKVIMPWHRLRKPEPKGATAPLSAGLDGMRGDQLPTITGYLGHTHHVMAGYVQSITTPYTPDTGMETWTVTIQKLNTASLRREPPKHDGVPDPSGAVESGGRVFDPTHLNPAPQA